MRFSSGLVDEDGEHQTYKTINSGLSAGMKQPRHAPEPTMPRRYAESNVAVAAAPEPPKGEMPPGFSLRAGGKLPGLWHTEAKEGGEPEDTWIGAPLHVLGETRDEHNTSWGKLLQWEDRDGVQHMWAMEDSLLVVRDSSAWLGRLVSEG